jgi:hypothetical protein
MITIEQITEQVETARTQLHDARRSLEAGFQSEDLKRIALHAEITRRAANALSELLVTKGKMERAQSAEQEAAVIAAKTEPEKKPLKS